jgi:hypothetical protein
MKIVTKLNHFELIKVSKTEIGDIFNSKALFLILTPPVVYKKGV